MGTGSIKLSMREFQTVRFTTHNQQLCLGWTLFYINLWDTTPNCGGSGSMITLQWYKVNHIHKLFSVRLEILSLLCRQLIKGILKNVRNWYGILISIRSMWLHIIHRFVCENALFVVQIHLWWAARQHLPSANTVARSTTHNCRIYLRPSNLYDCVSSNT